MVSHVHAPAQPTFTELSDIDNVIPEQPGTRASAPFSREECQSILRVLRGEHKAIARLSHHLLTSPQIRRTKSSATQSSKSASSHGSCGELVSARSAALSASPANPKAAQWRAHGGAGIPQHSSVADVAISMVSALCLGLPYLFLANDRSHAVNALRDLEGSFSHVVSLSPAVYLAGACTCIMVSLFVYIAAAAQRCCRARSC